jgi:hypothetical protein
MSEEMKEIKDRLERIERHLGIEIVEPPAPRPANSQVEAKTAVWTYMPSISSWNVFVHYECTGCGKTHAANEIIHASRRDGQSYPIRGACGAITDVKITKGRDSDEGA